MSEPPASRIRRGSRVSTRPGDRLGRLPAVVRRAAQLGRAEHDRLPAAGRRAVPPLGGGDSRRLPLRGQDGSPEPRRRLHGARACARRQARPGTDRRPAGARRRVSGTAARLARPRARLGARLSPRVLGRRRDRPRGGRERRSTAMRRSATCGSATRRTTRHHSRSWRSGYGRSSPPVSRSTRTFSTRTSRRRPRTQCGCSNSSPPDASD